ncbi:hypothetical protein IMZ48_46595 [Candidatus Bathyarchaeota archaeon]|nr:hypothetical protein [Candidatus Bathyarchaeota archaeon]
MKVIHRPPGERKVDIIFVHGLGGSSHTTWCSNRDHDAFWPLLYLPSEPGLSDARIMTFGYNANFQPGSNKSKTSILDFAKELLFDMKYGRDETVEEHEALGLGTVGSSVFA